MSWQFRRWYDKLANKTIVAAYEAERVFWKIRKPEQVRQLEQQIQVLSPNGQNSWYYHLHFGYGVAVRPDLKRDPHSGENNWAGFLSKHLPDLEGKRVLDIGCNAGLYDLRMIEAGAVEVVGVDVDARIRQAEFVQDSFAQKTGRDYSRVRYVAADVTKFDLTSLGTFDLTCMFCVAYHLGVHINEIMQQLSQITPAVALQGNLVRLTKKKYRDRPYQHLAGVRGMVELLETHGFGDVKITAPEGHQKPLVIGVRSVDRKRPVSRFEGRK